MKKETVKKEKLKLQQTTPLVGTSHEKELDDEIEKATMKPKKQKKGLKIAFVCFIAAILAGGIAAAIILLLR